MNSYSRPVSIIVSISSSGFEYRWYNRSAIRMSFT